MEENDLHKEWSTTAYEYTGMIEEQNTCKRSKLDREITLTGKIQSEHDYKNSNPKTLSFCTWMGTKCSDFPSWPGEETNKTRNI